MLLHDVQTERRLFGALVVEPLVLGWCDDVETDDFSDLHLQFAFMALRNIQARGKSPCVTSIADELDRLGYVQVNIMRVTQALQEPAYNDAEILVRHDARWLRRLANRRRNA